MVDGAAISDLFSQFAGFGKIKLLIHGSLSVSGDSLVDRFCSLNFEHVSPSDLIRQEISRRTQFGVSAERCIRSGQAVSEGDIVSLVRRWFWARKPDAGFAITGFPATLLQAKIFDEWIDARGEFLNGVLAASDIPGDPIIEHYRTLGLLMQTRLPLSA